MQRRDNKAVGTLFSHTYTPYSYTFDDLKAALLREFKGYGLREHHFKNFDFKPRVKESESWNPGLYIILAKYLFKDKGFSPRHVMREMNGLMFYQTLALKDCYNSGLRAFHLRQWNPSPTLDEFTYRHSRALSHMIKELHQLPMSSVLSVSWQEDANYNKMLEQVIALHEYLSTRVPASSHLRLFDEVNCSDRPISSDKVLESLVNGYDETPVKKI